MRHTGGWHGQQREPEVALALASLIGKSTMRF
jgi:hypothetical protein